ncbi:MAG: hypothetical protein D6724_00010 [Armatimonadetes bacterium]|nr:MAG: hypothetical protein D6724_00010 [Armatimonadota bacterium]
MGTGFVLVLSLGFLLAAVSSGPIPQPCQMLIKRGFLSDEIFCASTCSIGGSCAPHGWGPGPSGQMYYQCRCGGQGGQLDPASNCHATLEVWPDGSWIVDCFVNGNRCPLPKRCVDMTGPGGCPVGQTCPVCQCL